VWFQAIVQEEHEQLSGEWLLSRQAISSVPVPQPLLATTFSAAAHHGSNVSYHTDQTMTIAGTVTEWEFINPHPQIYFDVKTETGEIVHWASELLPTPSMMRNMKVGWTRTTLKPGDQIVLVCNPPRAVGAKACLAKELKINGKDWPVAPGGGAPGAAKGKQ
jgi:hypothetical protein